MELLLEERTTPGYERLIEVREKSSGLHAFIALHDLRLGPGLGGVRMYPYKSEQDAIFDVLRLAEGMTYKAGAAETGTGGAKSVIWGDPKRDKTEAKLLAFGAAVESLGGKYIAAQDSGTTLEDLAVLRRATRYVVGLEHPKSSGDPSRFTAWGGFRGIQALCHVLFGSDSLEGKIVAIQGLGAVGMRLAHMLFWHGARLIVSDLDESRVQQAVKQLGARGVRPEEILVQECDILAPCALGAILNSVTIPGLRCRGVGGLANNQLATPEDGVGLAERGILYAPDYYINAGGLINVCAELEEGGYCPQLARDKTDLIYERLLGLLAHAHREGIPAHRLAHEAVEVKLKAGTGVQRGFVFHHDVM